MAESFWRQAALAGALLAVPPTGAGIEGLALKVGDIQGSGWSAQEVEVQLKLSGPDKLLARITAERLVLSETFGPMSDVQITCHGPELEKEQWRCHGARIEGRFGELGRQSLIADVAYEPARGLLNFDVRGLQLAGTRIDVAGRWSGPGWELAVQTGSLRVEDLPAFITRKLPLLQDFSSQGGIRLRGRLSGGATLGRAEAQVRIESLTTNNEEGTIATDGLSMSADIELSMHADELRFDAELRAAAGQLWRDPVFIDLAAHPLSAKLGGRWRGEAQTLVVDRLEFELQQVARGVASAEIALQDAARLGVVQLTLDQLQFPAAYTLLLQPFLLETGLRELDTSGRIDGLVRLEEGTVAMLDLRLHEFGAVDAGGKFGIEGLNGSLFWSKHGQERPSSLAWRSASAYGLSGGAAGMEFIAAGGDFRLLSPTLLPVLDGGLSIDVLELRNAGTDELSVRFEGELLPISMPGLCRAFGWPEFAGKLSGRIPRVNYDDGVLSLGGALEAGVFGGEMTVLNLGLREPFGQYPRLRADVVFRNLDLEALTGVFSFGSITGRLHGEILGLELFRWSPVRMDARFYTPPDDRSRRLISQRAIRDLSSIGGAAGSVTAALQGGVLRFFENFRYRRLGISCRLENGVCRMDGVAPAQGGAYYIVQGSGLPRIDVIGNAHRVDWDRLVAQLVAMQNAEGAVVER